jgi:organic radical activating enzyme
MKLLGKYINGNYTVTLFDDGTKIRETEADFFDAEFPENIDCKITDFCDRNCPMCHENSSINGKHANILGLKFIDTLMPHTEIAIGGGSPTDHPDFKEFLIKLKNKQIVANITVNQVHFERDFDYIKSLCEENLFKGIGVSIVEATPEFLEKVKRFEHAVIHTINGVHSMKDYQSIANNGLKVLILGYKNIRKGETYLKNMKNIVDFNQKGLYNVLPDMLSLKWFKVVCFDNLAIKQLDVKRLLSEYEWNEFYMGDDGRHTMYIDAVRKEYAVSSTDLNRYKISDNIVEMFDNVKKTSKEQEIIKNRREIIKKIELANKAAKDSGLVFKETL